MYYPYFRGKQFELIAIRETAQLMADRGFVPIIEPVKAQLKGLGRAIDAICEANGKAIVIVNPCHGDHSEDGEQISKYLRENYIDRDEVIAGLLLTEEMTLKEVVELHNAHRDKETRPIFIHAGFLEGKALAEKLADKLADSEHVFLEQYCTKLYRKHYVGATRVLIRDGFQKRRNADHPQVEVFSDLHVTYEDEGMEGFGDFLMVGDEYSESGGPAYAVAIHLTFINREKDDEMYIYHFVSDRKDTPTDPAGKFGEALTKLVIRYQSGASQLYKGTALSTFLELHDKGHFPGLGQAKKLSMIHHIETIADYFS